MALKQLDEGRHGPAVMHELRPTTDFGAAKVTVHVLFHTMSPLVVQERHLWLNIVQMRDAEKVHFLNAAISQEGLFGDTIQDFSQQFSAVKK
ncbi:MAG: hypothetical protein ACRC9V_04865 [Aeromonas sp.]